MKYCHWLSWKYPETSPPVSQHGHTAALHSPSTFVGSAAPAKMYFPLGLMAQNHHKSTLCHGDWRCQEAFIKLRLISIDVTFWCVLAKTCFCLSQWRYQGHILPAPENSDQWKRHKFDVCYVLMCLQNQRTPWNLTSVGRTLPDSNHRPHYCTVWKSFSNWSSQGQAASSSTLLVSLLQGWAAFSYQRVKYSLSKIFDRPHNSHSATMSRGYIES